MVVTLTSGTACAFICQQPTLEAITCSTEGVLLSLMPLSFILHAAADLKMDGTGLKQALCLQKNPWFQGNIPSSISSGIFSMVMFWWGMEYQVAYHHPWWCQSEQKAGSSWWKIPFRCVDNSLLLKSGKCGAFQSQLFLAWQNGGELSTCSATSICVSYSSVTNCMLWGLVAE